MEQRKAELIHTFEKDEEIVETVLMDNVNVLIILTTKAVYKLDLSGRTTASIRAI